MIAPVLEAEPACPNAAAALGGPATANPRTRPLQVVLRAVAEIEPAVWDRLAARSTWATPFSRWAFHRAWWDAYSDNAHEETLVLLEPGAAADAEPVAIVPLMHRHGVEPTDARTHTRMRQDGDPELSPVPPHAKVLFLGATYHADYATILASEADLPAVAEAVAEFLARDADTPAFEAPWDVVDLRRFRCGDPAADELARALSRRAAEAGWTVDVEREDVSPVISFTPGGDIDDYLATLTKKARHEIRRKIRRAEAAGEVALVDSADPVADLEAFIELHQKRWGAAGLFPDTLGGQQSRTFFRRLFELFGSDGSLRLSFLTVGGQRIAAGMSFGDADSDLYYNAGVDPEAFSLSPGVVLLYHSILRAMAEGKSRMDMLRGDEAYKYEWGAVDEPIQRILVCRT